MDKKLDEALVRDFPLLYRDRHGNMRETCMCWGFPRNGWEPLIRELSEKIEAIIKRELPNAKAMQVKEKFGGLCFYMTATNDEIDTLIDEAETRSETICEDCGKPSKIRKAPTGWLVNNCDECWEKEKERWK